MSRRTRRKQSRGSMRPRNPAQLIARTYSVSYIALLDVDQPWERSQDVAHEKSPYSVLFGSRAWSHKSDARKRVGVGGEGPQSDVCRAGEI